MTTNKPKPKALCGNEGGAGGAGEVTRTKSTGWQMGGEVCPCVYAAGSARARTRMGLPEV